MQQSDCAHEERLRGGNAIDFQDLVSRFTFDSATEFLIGHDVRVPTVADGLPPSNVVTTLGP